MSSECKSAARYSGTDHVADFFDFWRLMWPIDGVWSLSPPTEAREESDPLANLSSMQNLRIALATLWLYERRAETKEMTTPVLIVAPFALHDAAIADFAKDHSLVESLARGGVDWLALTFWKSASSEMRDYGIDAYLSDLNVAIDDLGGRASLIGLCQGGWLAAAYAARFPQKVIKLVAVGAPIDLAAGPSQITLSVARTPPKVFQRLVELGGGRVLGRMAQPFWEQTSGNAFVAEEALQSDPGVEMKAKFSVWNARTVDLPGRYFLETAEWLFRENRLAENNFPALGRVCDLRKIQCPIFVLAASDDEIVATPQATALAQLCPQAHLTVRVVPGKHLSLFMGRDTLSGVWKEIAVWLRDPAA